MKKGAWWSWVKNSAKAQHGIKWLKKRKWTFVSLGIMGNSGPFNVHGLRSSPCFLMKGKNAHKNSNDATWFLILFLIMFGLLLNVYIVSYSYMYMAQQAQNVPTIVVSPFFAPYFLHNALLGLELIKTKITIQFVT